MLSTLPMQHHVRAMSRSRTGRSVRIGLLLTEDKDFGDLVFRQGRPVPGIVLLRIDPSRRLQKAARLMAAIDRFGDGLIGRYTVIEEARFRSRPLWPP
jgi:hypothetical protein